MLSSKTPIPTSQTFPAVDLTVLFAGFEPLVQGLQPDELNNLSLDIIKTLQGEGGALESLLAPPRRPDQRPGRQGRGDR